MRLYPPILCITITIYNCLFTRSAVAYRTRRTQLGDEIELRKYKDSKLWYIGWGGAKIMVSVVSGVVGGYTPYHTTTTQVTPNDTWEHRDSGPAAIRQDQLMAHLKHVFFLQYRT